MTYIKLDDAIHIMCMDKTDFEKVELMQKFPSINPESMIKKMIDEKLSMMQDNPYFHPEMGIDFLEELIQKFKS